MNLDVARKAAANQAKYGNYWAGKCVALIDRQRELEREINGYLGRLQEAHERIAELERELAAAARREAGMRRFVRAGDPMFRVDL